MGIWPPRRTAPAVGAILLLLLLLSRARAGDPQLAEHLMKQAAIADRARNHEEAAELYRRAAEEGFPLPEAALGEAEALAAAGKDAAAVEAWVSCLEDVGRMPSPTERQRRLAGRARKEIAKISPAGARFFEIEAQLVRDLVGFARRSDDRRAPWARRALRTALLLDPDDRGAARALDKLGEGPVAWGDGPWVDAFRFEDYFPTPHREGVRARRHGLTFDRKGPHARILWRKPLRGRWVIAATIRPEEAHDRRWQAGIVFGASRDPDREYSVTIGTPRAADLLRMTDSGDLQQVLGSEISDWDGKRPLAVRIEAEPGRIEVFVDGVKFWEYEAKDPAAFDGLIGVRVCRASATFDPLEAVEIGGPAPVMDAAELDLRLDEGKAALEADLPQVAAQAFRAAAADGDGDLRAVVGLARALAAEGKDLEADDLLARAVDREEDEGLSEADAAAVATAATLLEKRDPAELEWVRRVRAHRRAVVALAREIREGEPALAEFVLRRLLLVDREGRGVGAERLAARAAAKGK